MIKEYNCHSDERDLREVSGGGLGGSRKVQGVEYRGKGKIVFTSKLVKPGQGLKVSQNQHGKINVIDFAVNNWAQHEDMRNLVEKEKEDTKRRFKS
jgi:hypothetical protein